VEFTPDEPGEYLFRLNTRLVFQDDLYPDKQMASTEFKLTAEGDSLNSGCSTATGTNLSALALLGLCWAIRRRRRR
jgi:MYXO-CTERM domain-containing protein